MIICNDLVGNEIDFEVEGGPDVGASEVSDMVFSTGVHGIASNNTCTSVYNSMALGDIFVRFTMFKRVTIIKLY